MGHLNELLIQVAPHAPRRRVRLVKFGMGRLEVLQLPHHAVELLVGNLRDVQHIIIIVVAVQFIAKPLYLFLYFHLHSMINPDGETSRLCSRERLPRHSHKQR